jgi:cell division protein FtsI (penicillin-binding protein 3)
MGFLPADDPQLLGLIVIDDPKVDGSAVYGGSVAAPIFQAIAEDAVKVLQIEPDLPEQLVPEDPLPGVEISAVGGGASLSE